MVQVGGQKHDSFRGLRFLVETEWVEHFPEVRALIGVPQDAEWHPEGDVFTHTCHCLDALTQLADWRNAPRERRIVYMLAVLAHDFEKRFTTRSVARRRMRLVSPGHEEAGGPLAEQFLSRIGAPVAVRELVVPLVLNHLAHLRAITDRSVRRLAKRLQPPAFRICWSSSMPISSAARPGPKSFQRSFSHWQRKPRS
jgi:tRNA nucleotidyltransferase (CCA-adding enzyme)